MTAHTAVLSVSAKTEIAFIDTSVAGYLTLLDGIRDGVEVVLIDGAHDGLAQIASALAGRSDIDAVHVFAHGAPGTLQLGSARVSLANLDTYSAELAAVRAAMAPDGDLMLYGCDVAAGEAGSAFIDALAAATGADVAASVDATGSTLLDADWVLEVQAGTVETELALTAAGQQAYIGTLPIGDENFDGLGSINLGGTEMTAGQWTFTSDAAVLMAVATAEDPDYLGSVLNVDGGANDRAVLLNYQYDPGTAYSMKSTDGTNFALQSFMIGQQTGSPSIVTIEAYSGGALVVTGVSLDLRAGSTAVGGVSYTFAASNDGGHYGTLSFGVAYGDVDEIRFSFGGFADLQIDDIDVSPVDVTSPSVSGPIGVPGDGIYGLGDTLTFTVGFDENVTVSGGTSTLGLTIGATARTATFAAAVGNTITYTYTVQADDTDADGIAVGAIALGGSTIRDAAGHDANLALTGLIPSTAAVLVDTTAPAVSGNIAVPSAGTYVAGETLGFTVTFDDNVTVTGTDSALGLTIGGVARVASYATKTANSITYTYTVQAGDADSDGIDIGSLALGTSTIADAAGNDASVNLTGHIPATGAVLVDAIAPAVSGNIAIPANGTYRVGDVLTFTVGFDEDVAATGTDSTLGLTIGSSARSATFDSATANSITYTYTVQAGDIDANGIVVGAITAGTSTIRDAAGNDASLALTGHIPSTAGVLVDAVVPAVSGNVAVPADGAYRAGQTLSFTVTFDENVTVTGSDSALGLTVGGVARSATYDSKTANSITYIYTVQAGDTDADGITVGAIAPGATTIRDAAGNDANLALAGHVPSTAGVLVDTTTPSVSGNVAVPAGAVYRAGDNLDFTLTFNEAVTITGSDSTLALTVGGTAREAVLFAHDGATATYRYVVQAGDVDADGIAVGALSLGTSTIEDAAGNTADITLAGHVPDTTGVQVDGSNPVVAGTIAVPPDGSYRTGDTLTFTVTFSEDVVVNGTTSSLGLDIGGAARSAAFVSSPTANSITFAYTVQAGDGEADGIAVTGLTLNGATIRDAAGNDAVLALDGHVPGLGGVLVDAVAPTVGTLAIPANGTYGAGQQLDFAVTFSEDVTITGTDSALGLTVGAAARTAEFISGIGNTLTYRYTVQAGDSDADGIAIGAIALGASTIRDAAGNDAVTTINSPTGLLVDAVPPAVSGSIGVPADGTYMVGQNLDFTVTFDEDVTVSGSDSTLGLTLGASARSATFLSSSANSVTYRYTVQDGDVDADGIAVGAITLGGSTIRDAAGNDATLALAGHLPSTTAVLVDGSAPAVSGNIGVPANASYGLDQVLSFTVAFSENVTVTGTDSTLGLTIGGAARNAVFASSAGNSVTYTYTVQAGDADTDGIAVGAIALGASTIRDAAGNHAGLALAGHVPATTGVLVDTAGPTYTGATVNRATLVMSYADTLQLDAAHAPAAGAFTVMAGGSAVAVTAVAVNAAAKTVSLTLAAPVAEGQAVTVAYADPSGANDANAIQDAAGNDAADLAAVAVVNNTPAPAEDDDEEELPVTTIDGVPVQQSTVTNSDGTVSLVLTIPVVTPERVEQVGNNTVADIPLATGVNGASLLTAQVPLGFGLQASGAAQPGEAGNALSDLIREIQDRTTTGSSDQASLTGGGSGFVGGLPTDTPLLVQTIVPTAATGASAPAGALVITGNAAGTGASQTALVLDTRALPANTSIELHNVEFAAVIGAAHVTGGTGSQHVWGDGAAQTIFLGADDDVLHGGGGNDVVGSAGGNDQVFGDEGDDLVFGGEGDDSVDGGAGIDVVQLAGASRADYSLRVDGGKLVMTHLHGGSDGVDIVTNVEMLRFSDAATDMSIQGTTARLVEALTGAPADLATLDAMALAARNGATPIQIAEALYARSGVDGDAASDQAYFGMLYQNVFGRTADAGGLAFWTGQLQAGVSRAEVALALANSAEKMALPVADADFNASDVATLVRLYSALYERRPDEGGLNYWIGAHEQGMAMADIADAFVAAAEASPLYGGMDDAAFVLSLYRSALQRDAQAGEAGAWIDALDSGHIDRGDVLLAFANSAEKIALIGAITTSIDMS